MGGSSYLGLKNTWSGLDVGGALVARASSRPLLGETPNARSSLAGSSCPAPRRKDQTRLLGAPLVLPATQGRATRNWVTGRLLK